MNSACSRERLELALAGLLKGDDESTLHSHLDECTVCCAEIERLAGGERAGQEISRLLIPDELDDALPGREECSTSDFVVEHLQPSEAPGVLGRLGSYDVLEVIGHGGMGVVLKAHDRELKRFVAIKTLAPHLAHGALARKRFAREAQAAAAVVNPHVIAIHQVQPHGQLPYLVMPLLTGESLAERMAAQGTLELQEILRIGMQAAEGLAAAHVQGLIHRDIKPANILLEKGVERAVLTDFGLARAADDVSMTRWGIIAGTPEYMSPEQARGEALDGRSDLFSLGCVLYEMATGVSPFRADSTMATLRRIVDEQPAAMSSLAPDLPPWFREIVERLLSKDPSRRFASASEVRALLEQCLSHIQQPAVAPPPTSLALRDAGHRRMFTARGQALFALLGASGIAWLAFATFQPSKAPDESGPGANEPMTFLARPEQAKVNVSASPKFDDRVFVYRAEPIHAEILDHNIAAHELVLGVGAKDGVRFGHAFNIQNPDSEEWVGAAKVMELAGERCIARVVSMIQDKSSRSVKGFSAVCAAPQPNPARTVIECGIGKNVWQTESLENKIIRELLEGADDRIQILVRQESTSRPPDGNTPQSGDGE
jgi:serine/threonine protein kinase